MTADRLSFAGHVFPGATLPYGMVKAVGDSVSDNQGGFSLDSGQGKCIICAPFMLIRIAHM